eukprot:COSAG01_NODE_47603_length_388_cov_5.602076_1_plen_66_part_10
MTWPPLTGRVRDRSTLTHTAVQPYGCSINNSIRKIIQRIGPTEFSSGAGSTAGLQRRRGGNQQDQQ